MRTGNTHYESAGNRHPDEIDLRSLAGALWRSRFKIIIPALFLAVATLFLVGRMTPYYRSEARILIEVGENVYTRPTGVERQQREVIDEQAIQSQVQLVLSRSVANAVVEKAKLMDNPSFDPLSGGLSVPKWFMTVFGLVRDPRRMSAEERVVGTYYDGLTVYPVMRSRVIAIQFSSSNPATAAQIANLVAEEYLRLQQGNKQDVTRDATVWLGREIEELRKKVADAEGKVETFRAQSNLFLGANNATIATQQLGELNTQLTESRGALAEAQAKRQLIRDLIKGRGAYESLDVANSELIRRLAEQRVMLRATIAREGRTLLPAHPRMKELTAQLANLDEQVQQEAQIIARGIENEVKVATSRVDSLQQSIDAQKKIASVANEQDVQLRALEREAKAQRDLLEQFLTRFREASSRERPEAAQADARIISRASESNTPYFPKPLPIVILAFLGTLTLAIALVVAAELMAPRPYTPVPPRPYSPDDEGYDSGSSRSGAGSAARIAPAAPAGQRSSYRAERVDNSALARFEAEAYERLEAESRMEAPAADTSKAAQSAPVADNAAEPEQAQKPEHTLHQEQDVEPLTLPQPLPKMPERLMPRAARPAEEPGAKAEPSQRVAPVLSTSFLENDKDPSPLPEKTVAAKTAAAKTKDSALQKIYGAQSAAQSLVKNVQNELRLKKTEEPEVPFDDTSMLERLNRITQKTPSTPVTAQADTPVEEAPLLEETLPEAQSAPVTDAAPPAVVAEEPAALDDDSLKAFEKVKHDLMERLAEQSYTAPSSAALSTAIPAIPERPAMSQTPSIEAADATLVEALAGRLAAMPRGMEALSILVVGANDSIDAGHVALKLSRALAQADRKTVLLDTGSRSLDVAAALPQQDAVGFSDLIADKISFSDAIHQDKASPAHIIPQGKISLENTKKQSGMEVMFGALGFTYDFIVVAGESCLHEQAIRFMAPRCAAAILVSHGQKDDTDTHTAHTLLQNNGLNDVVVLLAESPAVSAMSRLPATLTERG